MAQREYEWFEWFLIILSYFLVIVTFPFSLCIVLGIASVYERAVVFRLGKSGPDLVKGPGVFFFLPCIDQVTLIDMRIVTMEIEPQEILTKDSVSIEGSAIVFYRVSDPYESAVRVNDFAVATYMLSSTTFRNTLAQHTLKDILQKKDVLSDEVGGSIHSISKNWGISIEMLEIKDLLLPMALVRSMAAEAEAQRNYMARLIKADGELNASETLKKASDLISSSSEALQLRYIQTLASIATEQKSTIIFPIPIDVG